MAISYEERNKYANFILDHAERLDNFANNEHKNRRDKSVAISSLAAIKDNIDKMELEEWHATRLKSELETNLDLLGHYREYYANQLEEWL